jgi:hypothetical protein
MWEKKNHGYWRSSIIPHILVRQVIFPFIAQVQPNFLDYNGFSYCCSKTDSSLTKPISMHNAITCINMYITHSKPYHKNSTHHFLSQLFKSFMNFQMFFATNFSIFYTKNNFFFNYTLLIKEAVQNCNIQVALTLQIAIKVIHNSSTAS